MCPTSSLWKSFGFLVVVVHAQSCLTLCDAMDYSPPGSSAHGLSRQEHWSGLPGPPPGDLSDPGSEPGPPALAGRFLTTAPPGKSRAPPQVQNSKFNQRNDKIQKAKENKKKKSSLHCGCPSLPATSYQHSDLSPRDSHTSEPKSRAFLVVHWLTKIHASGHRGYSSVPGQGTNIPHATQPN